MSQDSIAAFRKSDYNELAELAQEHLQKDLQPGDREILQKASTKVGTQAAIGSIIGVGLGLYGAYRLRRMRLDVFNALRATELPTHVKFADGRLGRWIRDCSTRGI
jgi:hypothetical protein